MGIQTCRSCGGKGRVRCPKCHGTGTVDGGTCDACGGLFATMLNSFGEGSVKCDSCNGTGSWDVETDSRQAAPSSTGGPARPTRSSSGDWWPGCGCVIVLVVLVFGGIYLWERSNSANRNAFGVTNQGQKSENNRSGFRSDRDQSRNKQQTKDHQSTEDQPTKAALVSIRFFEGDGASAVSEENRFYQVRFARSATRYVYWEVILSREATNRRTDFVINAVWRGPDELVLAQQHNARVNPNWTRSNSWDRWGWREPGNWHTGSYTVTFDIEGRNLGSGTFEIY
jgi:hypothetical protein